MTTATTARPGRGTTGYDPGFALAASLLGFFVITLDALVVNVALPSIRRDLGGGMTGLQWVVDGYTLAFAALLLSAGSLADRVGARRAYAAGLVVFVAASAACGLAPSLSVLVLARLVQGAGASVMMPASLALLRQAYPDPARRARAIALWAVGGAVASSAGPVAGGAANLLSWRAIFFINVPAGVVALVLLARAERSPRRPVSFDWAGQLAAVTAMGALTYGAIEAGASGPGARERAMAALSVAVLAAVMFVVTQARGANPMVPLGLFRSRTVVVCAAGGFSFMVGFYGLVFLLSLYFQQVRGLSSLDAGLAFVPMTLLSAYVNPASARIAERFGSRVPIAGGLFSMAVGLASVCLAPVATPVWLLALLMIPVGAGGALAMPPVTALLLESVPAERAGMASGVFNTCRQLGGALAVAVFGALVADQARFLHGMHVSLLIAVALLVAAGAASLTLPGRRAAAAGRVLAEGLPNERPAPQPAR